MDPLVPALIATAVAALYAHHLWHSYRLWMAFRDGRALRNALIAFMLAIGTLAIALSAWADVSGSLYWPARAFRLMTNGSLIVVGLFLLWSWHRR